MSDLFRREARVVVGGTVVHSQVKIEDGRRVTQGLDVAFHVERSRTREPNTCELRIWNLNADHRGQIQSLGKTDEVSIQAGYAGNVGEIFRGTVREAYSQKERVDWVTVVEASDGGRKQRTKRINQSFPPGTTVARVLETLAKKLEVGFGSSSRTALATATLQLEDRVALGREFVEGTIVSGAVADELTRILDSAGLEWSIQNEELQILERGGALQKTAVRLAAPGVATKATGLVGSPEIGAKGIVRARALLNPELVPGRKVEIESRQVLASLFTIRRVDFLGDTAGQDWYADIEAKEG